MKVSIFITCLVDTLFPDVGIAMAKILHACNVQVEFIETQTCCGQPAFNSGYHDEARTAAKTILDSFQDADYVVSPSGSCTSMIEHYYPELFQDDVIRAEQVAQLRKKMYEFSQFLVHVLGITQLGAIFPHRVTYHPSCHGSRLLGVRDEPLQLLSAVSELHLVDLPYANDCCGFGGTFAVKMGDISSAMVSEKAAHILATDAEVLVGTDMGCLMNIGGRLQHAHKPIRVMHLAQLLYEGIKNSKVGIVR